MKTGIGIIGHSGFGKVVFFDSPQMKAPTNIIPPVIEGTVVVSQHLSISDRIWLTQNRIEALEGKMRQWVQKTNRRTKYKPLTLAQWHSGYKAKLGLQREISVSCP